MYLSMLAISSAVPAMAPPN
uniref:Uncharacterized protein n=1 Tax=Arundo donax TaxID=35708 RepID=A0A0A9BMR1_ARUDO